MEEDMEQVGVNNFAKVQNTHSKTYTYI